MTPEELVKQLRLPDRIHIGKLMRDAADMIERLRDELASAEADIDDMRGTHHPGQFCPNIRGQVERLEAQIDRLRAESPTDLRVWPVDYSLPG